MPDLSVNKTLAAPDQEGDLPALTGSDKQVAWATEIRTARLNIATLDTAIPGEPPTPRAPQDEFLRCLQGIRRAHWWIETRTLGRDQFMQAAFDEGIKARYVTPPKDNATAHAVLDEALLAPTRTRGPIAEVSLAAGKVRVVLIEFDEDTNTLLKRCGYRWDAPAWTRPVAEDVAEHRAIEIAVRLLAHGCPVRIFDEALRQRAVANDYEPEPPRRVEVSTSAKYRTKFHLVWALDEKPVQCRKAAQQLRGAKVFDDGAYVSASHFEEIQDFASQNGFTITPEAQSLIDAEKGKLAGSVRVTAKPRAVKGHTPKPALPIADGKIDADLLDD
ncbi:MAG: hypothetical protein ACYCS8_08230 [Acidithiobacillus sp.]